MLGFPLQQACSARSASSAFARAWYRVARSPQGLQDGLLCAYSQRGAAFLQTYLEGDIGRTGVCIDTKVTLPPKNVSLAEV